MPTRRPAAAAAVRGAETSPVQQRRDGRATAKSSDDEVDTHMDNTRMIESIGISKSQAAHLLPHIYPSYTQADNTRALQFTKGVPSGPGSRRRVRRAADARRERVSLRLPARHSAVRGPGGPAGPA